MIRVVSASLGELARDRCDFRPALPAAKDAAKPGAFVARIGIDLAQLFVKRGCRLAVGSGDCGGHVTEIQQRIKARAGSEERAELGGSFKHIGAVGVCAVLVNRV